MVSEVIRGTRVVVVRGIVDVLAVSLIVGVLGGLEFGVVREEQAVPGTVLLLFLELLVAEGLVVSLQHRALSHIQALLRDHGGEWSEVWSRIPCVLHLVAAQSVESEGEAADEASGEEAASEDFSCIVTGIHVNEIVDHALRGDNGYSTLILLRSPAHPDAQGGTEDATDDGVGPESELVLILNFTLVLPCPPLRVRHILTEAQCNPGVASVFIAQPKHNDDELTKWPTFYEIIYKISNESLITYQSMYSFSSA